MCLMRPVGWVRPPRRTPPYPAAPSCINAHVAVLRQSVPAGCAPPQLTGAAGWARSHAGRAHGVHESQTCTALCMCGPMDTASSRIWLTSVPLARAGVAAATAACRFGSSPSPSLDCCCRLQAPTAAARPGLQVHRLLANNGAPSLQAVAGRGWQAPPKSTSAPPPKGRRGPIRGRSFRCSRALQVDWRARLARCRSPCPAWAAAWPRGAAFGASRRPSLCSRSPPQEVSLLSALSSLPARPLQQGHSAPRGPAVGAPVRYAIARRAQSVSRHQATARRDLRPHCRTPPPTRRSPLHARSNPANPAARLLPLPPNPHPPPPFIIPPTRYFQSLTPSLVSRLVCEHTVGCSSAAPCVLPALRMPTRGARAWVRLLAAAAPTIASLPPCFICLPGAVSGAVAASLIIFFVSGPAGATITGQSSFPHAMQPASAKARSARACLAHCRRRNALPPPWRCRLNARIPPAAAAKAASLTPPLRLAACPI